MIERSFSVGEVAAMVGVTPHTIRAWERRHGVVTPVRSASGQRRYTEDDVELLRQVKHERHVHGLSMRLATLVTRGMVAPDPREPPAAKAPPMLEVDDPLRMVVDLVPEVVIVVDKQGAIQYANTAFVRFFGLLRGEVRHTRFADLASPFDRAKAVQTYQPPLKQRRGWELSLRSGRGTTGLFSFDCWPCRTSAGGLMILVGRNLGAESVADGTRDEAMETGLGPAAVQPLQWLPRLLRGAADPVRTLGLLEPWLKATATAVALFGAGGQLVLAFANPRFQQSVAPTLLPLVGRTLDALWPGDVADTLVAAGWEAIRERRSQRQPGLALAAPGRPEEADGAARWDVELWPVTNANGGVTHLLLLSRDVTAERSAFARIHALGALSQALGTSSDPHATARLAISHAQPLLPHSGALVAVLNGRRRRCLRVLAATGVFQRFPRDQDLTATLVSEAIATSRPVEVVRDHGDGAHALRIVPLQQAGAPPRRHETRGALAFARPDSTHFSEDERQLIDELGGRLSAALARSETSP